jgi:hypothetical protein
MSDRPQSTPQYVTPPLLDPATWENHQGFRESFLVQFLDPRDNFVLRGIGALLYDLVLAHNPPRGGHPAESSTVLEMRAALGDLRHLQGFLGMVDRSRVDSILGAADTHLSTVAGVVASDLGILGAKMEQELGPWLVR